MESPKFFEEIQEQSIVKATIVAKYFSAWANVVKKTAKQYINPPRIAYVDLFSGPGRYKDGSISTPLLVLERAISDNDMRKILVTIFNDKDDDNVQKLISEIQQMPGVGQLRYTPRVFNKEVGSEIVKLFEHPHEIPDLFYFDRGKTAVVPTLFFVDPWGYKGLSLKLINSILQHWGSDIIVFFNYNRINMGLNNTYVMEHMNALFGDERAELLRQRLEKENFSPATREMMVIEAIAKALQDMGGKFVLPFRFKNERGNRTSHHLIFASKSFKGYEMMKEIMAKESTLVNQGVPSFEYNPATERQPILFELVRPLDDLATLLKEEFKGQTLDFREIYMKHSIGRPYIRKNYREVLLKLEESGEVMIIDPENRRRNNTLADRCLITF